MSVAHYYAGPAAVTFTPRDTSSGLLVPGQAVVLGINRDAIPVITQPKFADVMSDDWGGENGVPSDSQYMGAIAVIQLSLIKFELAAIDRLMTGASHYTSSTWNTAGEGFPFGGLIRAGGLMGQLVLNSANAAYTDSTKTNAKVMTFPYVFVRNGGSVNQGTAAASYDLQFEAWMNASLTRQLYTVAYTTPT
jgi:hypothetical protein